MTGDSSVSWVCMFSHQGVFPIGRIIFHNSNVVSNVENQGSFPRPFQMLWSARRAGYVVHGRWLEKPRVGMGSQWLCKAQSVAKTCRNHMWNTVMMRFAVNTRDFCSGGCHESSRKRRANRTKLIGVLATALVGSGGILENWDYEDCWKYDCLISSLSVPQILWEVLLAHEFVQCTPAKEMPNMPLNLTDASTHHGVLFLGPKIMRDCLPLLISHESLSISIEAGLSMPKGCSNLQWPFWSRVDWVVLTNTTQIEHGASWDQEITKGFEDDSPKMEAWLWHAMNIFDCQSDPQ